MPLRKKELFLMKGKKFLRTLSRGGGGAKGFSGRATRKGTFFCSFPYIQTIFYHLELKTLDIWRHFCFIYKLFGGNVHHNRICIWIIGLLHYFFLTFKNVSVVIFKHEFFARFVYNQT